MNSSVPMEDSTLSGVTRIGGISPAIWAKAFSPLVRAATAKNAATNENLLLFDVMLSSIFKETDELRRTFGCSGALLRVLPLRSALHICSVAGVSASEDNVNPPMMARNSK